MGRGVRGARGPRAARRREPHCSHLQIRVTAWTSNVAKGDFPPSLTPTVLRAASISFPFSCPAAHRVKQDSAGAVYRLQGRALQLLAPEKGRFQQHSSGPRSSRAAAERARALSLAALSAPPLSGGTAPLCEAGMAGPAPQSFWETAFSTAVPQRPPAALPFSVRAPSAGPKPP